MKPAHLGFAVIFVGTGCGRSFGLGTDVVWSTGFESGNLLSDWDTAPGIGGAIESDAGGSNPSIIVTTEQAHTGMYSAKFSSVATIPWASPYDPGGGCLYKESAFPQSAYYSAWYFIPAPPDGGYYETLSAWSILKFMVPLGDSATDGGVPSTALGQALDASELFDLSLLSLPGSQMTLNLFDARHQYLESPLPDPVPYLPMGQWFQIECLYRNDSGSGGELAVWLDGAPIYDVRVGDPWVILASFVWEDGSRSRPPSRPLEPLRRGWNRGLR